MPLEESTGGGGGGLRGYCKENIYQYSLCIILSGRAIIGDHLQHTQLCWDERTGLESQVPSFLEGDIWQRGWEATATGDERVPQSLASRKNGSASA